MAMKRTTQQNPQPIQVFVRTRPLNTQEKENQQTSCVDILSSKELSVRQQFERKYAFNRVFASDVKQVDVYKAVVYPLISEVLTGYNCTVFAYGQTGSGKTHTMVGDPSSNFEVPWQDDDLSGIVPRAMANLFDELHLTQQENTVRVSYIELYNEEVYDLLSETDDNASASRIRIFEDRKGSVTIQGISQTTVVSNQDVKKILDKGQEKRRTAATLMNSQSSRSHTVFTITVHTRETTAEGDVVVKTGKLNLVDLAGSENIRRSGVIEKRAREAGSINQSLLTLGRVIKSLVDRSGHIPYRESKLTRILQESLGGRTKTSIIATISPAICNLEETLSTLDYVYRAQNVTNLPEVNQRMSQNAVLGNHDEIEKLRQDLQASRSGSGVYLAQENYEQLIACKDNDKQELSHKIQHIRDLEKSLKELEAERDEIRLNWNKINESFKTTNEEQNICREKSEQLHDQIQSLVIKIKTSENIDAALRAKIEKLYATAKENRNTSKQLSNIINIKFADICDHLAKFKIDYQENNDHVCGSLDTIQNKLDSYIEIYEAFIESILRDWKRYFISQGELANTNRNYFESCVKDFVGLLKNDITKIKKHREEEHSLIKKLKNEVSNKTKQAKLLDDIESNSARMGETVEALLANIDLVRDILLLKNKNDINKDQLELAKCSNDLSSAVLQQTIKVNDTASELNSNLTETRTCVQNFAKQTSLFENQLLKDLSECQDTVATFTNVKYKEIVPSGDTPEKMQYDCPNVNPPTPKEPILGQFQGITMETINEPTSDIETMNEQS